MKNNPRKEQILKTAQKRFIKHGLSKTSIEEIARDLRIGKATVYHYFKSKEDIFYDALNEEIEKFLEEQKENLFGNEVEFSQKIFNYITIKEDVGEKYPLVMQLFHRFIYEQALEKDFSIQKIFIEKETNLLLEFLKFSFNKKIIDPSIAQILVLQSWGIIFIKKLDPEFKISEKNFLKVFFNKLYNLFLS
jgi:AcrR family transcriptional regulator